MARYGSYAGGGSYLDAVQDEMGYGTTGTGRSSFGGYGTYLDGSYGQDFAASRRAQDAGDSRISIKDAFDLVRTAADIKNRRDRLEFDREQHKENVRATQAREQHNKDVLDETKRANDENERKNKASEAHNTATLKHLQTAQDFELREKQEAAKRKEDDDFLQASRALSDKDPSFTAWLDNDLTLSDEEEKLIKDSNAKAKAGRMATFIKVLSGGQLTESDLDRANEAFGFDGQNEWFDKIEVDKDGNAALMAYMKDKKTGKQVRVAYPFNEESYADVVDSAVALYQTRPDLTRKILNSLPENIRNDAIGNIRARGAERRVKLEHNQELERDQIRSNQAYTIAKNKEIDKLIEELEAQKSTATEDADVAKLDDQIKSLNQMKRELFGLTSAGQTQLPSASGSDTGDTPSTGTTTVVGQTNGVGDVKLPRQ